MDYQLKDGGARETHCNGAVREPVGEGKGRYDLISPIALHRLALVCQKGAVKYSSNSKSGARNWEGGIPLGRYLDSALRHLNQHREGMRDEDHISMCLWNIMAFIHTEEMIKRGVLPEELNDVPSYIKENE